VARKTERTNLNFTATVGKVEIAQAKTDYQSRVVGGGLNLTLRIDMPQPPEKPYARWPATDPQPKAPTKKKNESDADFKKREKAHETELARWQEARAVHQAQMELYRKKAGRVQNDLLQYAQLVGIGSLLGARKVTVSITPHGQDLLPGFGAALVEAEDLPALGSGDDGEFED